MTILRKIIDCQSFKNSQENVQDGVYFSKVASLQCTDCTLFSEIVPKTSFLKRTFFKKFMVQHRFNRVWPCSAHPALLPKPQLTLDLTEEALKIHPWWKLFFSKNASLEFIPCDFIKSELHHRDYLAWVLQGTFFNILENFLRGITVISFIQEVITLLKGLGLVSQDQTFTTV